MLPDGSEALHPNRATSDNCRALSQPEAGPAGPDSLPLSTRAKRQPRQHTAHAYQAAALPLPFRDCGLSVRCAQKHTRFLPVAKTKTTQEPRNIILTPEFYQPSPLSWFLLKEKMKSQPNPGSFQDLIIQLMFRHVQKEGKRKWFEAIVKIRGLMCMCVCVCVCVCVLEREREKQREGERETEQERQRQRRFHNISSPKIVDFRFALRSLHF